MFNIFSFILALVPGVVKGIQMIHGDTLAGVTKAQMAQDALQTAVQTASTVLTGDSANYAQAAGAVAQLAIDQTVKIAKATGAYNKWTAIAAAAQQDLQVATQITAPAPTTSASITDTPKTTNPPAVEAPGVAH